MGIDPTKTETGQMRRNGGVQVWQSRLDKLSAARDTVNGRFRDLIEVIQKRPGTSLAVALGAGYMMGRLLRR